MIVQVNIELTVGETHFDLSILDRDSLINMKPGFKVNCLIIGEIIASFLL